MSQFKNFFNKKIKSYRQSKPHWNRSNAQVAHSSVAEMYKGEYSMQKEIYKTVKISKKITSIDILWNTRYASTVCTIAGERILMAN